jgi:hypothetical protein
MRALASGRSCTDGRALAMLTWSLAGMALVVACGGNSVGSGATPPDLIETTGGSPVEIDGPGGSRPTDTQQGGSAGAAAGGAISMGGEQAGGAIPMGGAAVGGVASGGAPGGTAGAPAIAPPESCDLSGEFNRVDNCALEATCGFDYYAIECTEAEAGEWQCGCRAKSSAEYRVATTSPAVACLATMRACSGTDPTFEETPEDCELSQSSGSDGCELSEACSRPMALGPGESPVLTETRSYSCSKAACPGGRLLPGRRSLFDPGAARRRERRPDRIERERQLLVERRSLFLRLWRRSRRLFSVLVHANANARDLLVVE